MSLLPFLYPARVARLSLRGLSARYAIRTLHDSAVRRHGGLGIEEQIRQAMEEEKKLREQREREQLVEGQIAQRAQQEQEELLAKEEAKKQAERQQQQQQQETAETKQSQAQEAETPAQSKVQAQAQPNESKQPDQLDELEKQLFPEPPRRQKQHIRPRQRNQREWQSTPRPQRVRQTERDMIPFDLPEDLTEDLAEDLVKLEEDEAARNTITTREKIAFKRIFREITHKKQATADSRTLINTIVDQAADDLLRDRNKAGGANGAATDAEAASPPDSVTERRQRAALSQFPASLRTAASAAIGIKAAERERRVAEAAAVAANVAPEPVDPNSPAVVAREALRVRQTKMELQMVTQKSDFELWDYMERNVFTLVDEFGLRPQAKSKTPNRKNAPASPGQARRALATYAPLYAALLMNGVRLMDMRFGGSALGRAILPRVKALGLASYVLGAGTALYNAELVIRWGRQGDWAAALGLLSEMQRAGLAFDANTLAVVRSMEWHLIPVIGQPPIPLGTTSSTPGTPPRIGFGIGSEALAQTFSGAAARQQPEMASLPAQLAYWRQQVEISINWGKNRQI